MTKAVPRLSLLFLPWLAASMSTGCSDAASPDVVIQYESSYGASVGATTRRAPTTSPFLRARIFGGLEGATIAEGRFAGGRATFPDVPPGAYVLRIERAASTNFPTDLPYVVEAPHEARTLRYGLRHWARDGIETTTDSMIVALEADGFTPWVESDDLLFVSRTTDLARAHTDDVDDPAAGATIGSWTLDVQDLTQRDFRSAVAVLTDRDDLSLVQLRRLDGDAFGKTLQFWDPYYASSGSVAIASGPVTGRWDPGAEVPPLEASLTAAPTTMHTIDFRGATFAALRTQLGLPSTAAAFVEMAITHEPGTTSDYFTGIAPPIWEIESDYTGHTPVNPTCYPDLYANCSAVACPGGCDDTVTNEILDPGDLAFSLALPRPYTTPGTDVIEINYVFRQSFKHPITMETKSLYLQAHMFALLSSVTGQPIVLALGPPRDVRVAGMMVPWVSTLETNNVTSGVGLRPTIAFAPPVLGTPTRYEVVVWELETTTGTDMTKRYSRSVATIESDVPSVRVPEDVLVAGRHYYATVAAIADGLERADYRVSPRATPILSTQAATGVFTP